MVDQTSIFYNAVVTFPAIRPVPILFGDKGTLCVSNLPRVVAWQWNDRESKSNQRASSRSLVQTTIVKLPEKGNNLDNDKVLGRIKTNESHFPVHIVRWAPYLSNIVPRKDSW